MIRKFPLIQTLTINRRFQSSLTSESLNSHPTPISIKIPNKIHRNELSILKALASCITVEQQSNLHGVVDDPHLVTLDYQQRKRSFLSKASGKLSARLAFEEIKHDFIRVANDEPKMRSVLPLLSPGDVRERARSEQISIDRALELIVRLLKPEDAWAFYQENENRHKFQQAVLEDLLELLCAMADSRVSEQMTIPPEELYYSKQIEPEWNLDCPAELLFNGLPDQSHRAFQAMIRGCAKHNNPFRALEFYDRMKSLYPSTPIDQSTINDLLRSLRFWIVSDSELKEKILELLSELSIPNVFSFNNAIFAFSDRTDDDFLEGLYQEMIALDIKPTLGTYCLLVKSNFVIGYRLNLAINFLEILERSDSDFEEIQSIDDLDVFPAMLLLFRRTNRLDLALRLNGVLVKGGRIHLLPGDQRRGFYCDSLIRTAIELDADLDVVFALVKLFVPGYCALIPAVVSRLIDRIEHARRYEFMPDLINHVHWSSRKYCDLDSLEKILSIVNQSFDKIDRKSLEQSFIGLREKAALAHVNTSIIRNPSHLQLIVEICWKLGSHQLLNRFIELAVFQQLLSPLAVRSLLIEKYQPANNAKAALNLIEQLVEGFPTVQTRRLIRAEINAMAEIIEFCRDEAVRDWFVRNDADMFAFDQSIYALVKLTESAEKSLLIDVGGDIDDNNDGYQSDDEVDKYLNR